MASSGASASSSASTPPATRAHYSGLWSGEARPAEGLQNVPVNPIKWALSLISDPQGRVSAFGGGYFDDAGDVPGQPVLHYTLAGTFNADAGKVSMTKVYVSRRIPEELCITYEGTLQTVEGQVTMSGTWTNAMEGTYGLFACILED